MLQRISRQRTNVPQTIQPRPECAVASDGPPASGHAPATVLSIAATSVSAPDKASSPTSTQMLSGTTLSLDTVRISDLPGLGRDGIHDLWRRLHRKPPPKGLTGELLVRALADRIQIERHGGLSRGAQQRLATAAREAARERATAGQDDHENAGAGAASRTLRPGTRLVREWQGEIYEVIALADGFLWNGASYRSLSMIAKAITGTVWNGWVFFGVERKKPRVRAAASSMPVERPLKEPIPPAPIGPAEAPPTIPLGTILMPQPSARPPRSAPSACPVNLTRPGEC